MEKNQETICVGMQLDFTATERLEKPLYPDEVPGECEALPVLWVLNTAGQLAGWTVIYKAGVKTGERPLSMRGLDVQEKYWAEERKKMVDQIDEKEMKDRELWEKEWRESLPADATQAPSPAIAAPQQVTVTPALAATEPTHAPKQVIATPVAKESAPISTPQQTTTPAKSPETMQQQTSPAGPSVPMFGKPSPLGMSGFGQPSSLGGSIPGQSGMYPGFTSSTLRPTHVFGQPTGLGTFGSSTASPASSGSGFAKYTPASQAGSGFLSAASKLGISTRCHLRGVTFPPGCNGWIVLAELNKPALFCHEAGGRSTICKVCVYSGIRDSRFGDHPIVRFDRRKRDFRRANCIIH